MIGGQTADIEAEDLSGCVLLEFHISEFHTLHCLIMRHFRIQYLHLIFEIFLRFRYAFCIEQVVIREYFSNNSDLIFLNAAFSGIDNCFAYTFNLLKISLYLLRVYIFSV